MWSTVISPTCTTKKCPKFNAARQALKASSNAAAAIDENDVDLLCHVYSFALCALWSKRVECSVAPLVDAHKRSQECPDNSIQELRSKTSRRPCSVSHGVLGETRALVDDERRRGGRWRSRVTSLGRRRRARRSSGRRCPSTWLAKPKTIPDWSASTVFLAITERGPEQLDLAQLGAAPAERLEGDLDAGRDRAADVLPLAR